MGHLTPFLQEQFERHCPSGWTCRHEVELLSSPLSRRLGYQPRSDVLLERLDGSRRLWIEFEVSRADPVANHVKFATSHLFQPQPPQDSFVAMVSAHVTRGRRNLAGHTVLLMRHLGMNAFQTVLLPQLSGEQIKSLNHTRKEELSGRSLPVEWEIERALAVSETVGRAQGHRIHYAGDWMDVWANVQRWNDELQDVNRRELWGRRTIKYFVFDPVTRRFAPSKFCAFLRVPDYPLTVEQVREEAGRYTASAIWGMAMSVPFYVSLDESETRFDGAIARRHLTERLAMRLCGMKEVPKVSGYFGRWQEDLVSCVRVHPDGPQFILPPGYEDNGGKR